MDPADGAITQPHDVADDDAPYPRMVGRYRVLGVLGTGGMGVVLSAHDPDLGRYVALKLVATAEPGAQARLLREAQAVARLAHPNVVAIHDVGTITNRVWVAMELVDGEDLEAWLARPRSRSAILDAFVQAGRGLAAAHRAGMVHRDFKPANVLIGRDRRVRVADFGLARMAHAADPSVGAGSSAAVIATMTDGLAGTPAYMAPEQIAGEPVTAAADQFAFCVALYRAVAGHRPCAGDDLAARLGEMTAERLQPIPRQRDVPRWLRAVLVRGLRRWPAARFSSMDELLAAISRGRRGRLRVGMTLGALAVVAIAVMVWSLAPPAAPPPCRGLDHHVAAVWNAERRASLRDAFAASKRSYGPALAERVIAELDRKAASWTRMRIDVCEATRVRGEQSEALLDARNRCLDRQLSELGAVASVFASPPSPRIVDEALSTVQGLAPVNECANVERLLVVAAPPPDPVTHVRIALAERERARARAQATSGDHRAALPTARAALALAESTGHAPLVAAVSRDVGDLERRAGDYAAAERYLDRALEAAVEARDATLEAEVLVSFLELRGRDQKRPKEAIGLARPIDATLARAGKPAAVRISALSALATAYRHDTDYEQQRVLLEQALALAEQNFGAEHLVTVGLACQLATALDDLRERERALPHAERCVAMRERALGAHHPDVARGLQALGIVYNGLQRRADAEAAYNKAIAIYEAALGPDDPWLANVYSDRATSQRRQDKLLEALASAERALAIDRKHFGEAGHVNVGLSQTSVGHLLRDLGRYDEALAMYRGAVEMFSRLLEPEHPYVGTTYASLGETYEKMKRYDAAIEMQERALAIQSKRPEHCAQPYMARVTLSEPLLLRGRRDDRARALGLLRSARDGLRGCGPKADREVKKLEGLLAKYRITL